MSLVTVQHRTTKDYSYTNYQNLDYLVSITLHEISVAIYDP